MWLWLDEVDKHVPPLLSGAAKRPKKAVSESGGGAGDEGHG